MPTPKRVLAFVDYYLPGFKGGGPAHSVSRLIERLQGDFEFSVFTRDRDLGDQQPYKGVPSGIWFEKAGVRYLYVNPRSVNGRTVLRAIRECSPDVVYLNSYFSKLTRIVLWARLLGKLSGIAILIAPRGEFSNGALGIKSLKKRLYVFLTRLANLHAGLSWHLSSVYELADARRVVGGEPEYSIVAPNMGRTVAEGDDRPAKRPGEAHFAFVSRIAPIKNLAWAIERLALAEGNVRFTIFGPAEDRRYWAECEQAMQKLPKNVTCKHVGPIPASEVVQRLAEHHFFLFPTQGENFGHVIPEALAAGCPVLLSDRTPWRDLDARGAGWVMPLEDPAVWEEAIRRCLAMDQAEFDRMSAQAQEYSRQVAEAAADSTEARVMFEAALERQLRAA